GFFRIFTMARPASASEFRMVCASPMWRVSGRAAVMLMVLMLFPFSRPAARLPGVAGVALRGPASDSVGYHFVSVARLRRTRSAFASSCRAPFGDQLPSVLSGLVPGEREKYVVQAGQ